MNRVSVSAPGKLMLLGEHAVVYNHPCLVTSVDQRFFLTAERINNDFLDLAAPDLKINSYRKRVLEAGKGETPKGARFVEIALKKFLKKFPQKSFGVKIKTKSKFSQKLGFGSSSAVVVCTIKALSELCDISMTKKELFDLSLKTVIDIQGKGSGFDIAAAVWGGTLYFLTAGKVIEPLKIDSLPLIIGYSGIKADTVELINKVLATAKKYPEQVEAIYGQIEKLVVEAKGALIAKNWAKLGQLMNLNQGYLEALGVGNKKLSNMIYAARDAGAYGAKLSGAGGGDCMIALRSAQNKQEIINAIRKAGGEAIDVSVGSEGVRIEE